MFVVLSCEGGIVADVYNLTVEQVPEYIANGVVVHNCYDALRYGLSSVNPRPRRQAEKLTPEMRAILNDPVYKKVRRIQNPTGMEGIENDI